MLQFDDGSGGNRGALRFVVGSSNGANVRVAERNNWSADNWYHVAVSYDSAADAENVKFFIDGQLDASAHMDVPIGTHDDPMFIGAERGNWQFLDGEIGEVRVWNVALSQQEIEANMHTRLTGNEEGLVGYWNFDDGEGQVAGDLSSNGNDGQLGSGPDVDDSDPNWVDSDAPVGICTPEGLVERNVNNALEIKLNILKEIEEALLLEDASVNILSGLFREVEYGHLDKRDIIKAKQEIHSAIQSEEQGTHSIEKSVDNLEDALEILDSEDGPPESNSVSENRRTERKTVRKALNLE